MTTKSYSNGHNPSEKRADVGDSTITEDAYGFASFFTLADFANGEGALPAFIAAHRFLAASAIAFRPAALNLRLRRLG